MNKNQKKVTAMTSGIAALAIAAGTIVGVMSNTSIEIPYNTYVVNQYVTEMSIGEPEGENIDLVELYCNGSLVDNTILPDGTFKSIPLVFTDLQNLEIKCYSTGKEKGSATFDENNKLIYKRTIGGIIE